MLKIINSYIFKLILKNANTNCLCNPSAVNIIKWIHKLLDIFNLQMGSSGIIEIRNPGYKSNFLNSNTKRLHLKNYLSNISFSGTTKRKKAILLNTKQIQHSIIQNKT